ncbi:hypothetical protein [Sphingobacterium bambusae]|uniref:Uncharacterized protein n=1 Tax=Sphingobacterium bambusae TaxID=662858 RepID=A0ABW6BC24_9SPHI|nr:hypothetical protein [Sphingobacterium bambusae]WPL46965.1 hypothetical protein SCB77_13440 [Sphingobacterium bambusae]
MENKNIEIPAHKLPYVAPNFEVISLELECSIAAGSATVKPQHYNEEVYESWDVETDDNRSINF